ncbi:TonB-dependent receptor plug domain-containing protein [Montanilutibacter psychrotolerans]|uniref:TonB-dependent receptor plug domain-containing protein n=1 Tax=Montanilutibacter psychrotolerans TaxID=1327343 RepID=UPI0016812B5F|nr:TonB-dependent receptor [Lysobacter psychrotolerans]
MRIHPSPLALAIACALSLFTVGAAATDAPERTASVALLDDIQVTATRREASALDVPVGITVVDGEQIKRMAPQTAADLLHGEPGTYVQQTTPGQGVVIVRGLKGSEVLHLVDGFRLNNAFFRNAPNQYIALVDPLNLERIEVARGPMSILYGSDAMGGVVQFLTPEPRFDGSDWQTRGVVRARLSSADDSNHSRVAIETGRAGLGLSAGVSYQNVGELRAGGGETLPYTAYSQRGGDIKLLWSPAEGHELMFSAQYARQPKTQRHDALVPGFRQTRADNAEFLFKPQERTFGQLRYRHTNPLAFADEIALQVGHQRIVDNRTTRETGTVNREIEANASRLWGFTAQLHKALGERHRLSYGAEYYQDTVDSFRERHRLDTGVVNERPSRYPDGSKMDSVGLYLADDWKLGERLDLNYGARYSRFDITMPATAAGPAVKLTPDDLSGHLGVAVRLGDRLRLVGNAGRAFRAPNIFDLGTFGSRPGSRFNIPNPNLKPEYVTTVDLGLKYAGEAWQWEAMAFRSNYRDKITSVLTGDTTASGLDVVQSRNATRLQLWGVESGVTYRHQALEAYATATYTRGDEQFDGGEYPADRVPPLFGKVGLRYAFDSAWEVEGWSLYASAQNRLSPRDAADPRVNPNGTGGWATLNARIGWRATSSLQLQLIAENLADKRYREHGSGLDEPGRNVSLALDWAF